MSRIANLIPGGFPDPESIWGDVKESRLIIPGLLEVRAVYLDGILVSADRMATMASPFCEYQVYPENPAGCYEGEFYGWVVPYLAFAKEIIADGSDDDRGMVSEAAHQAIDWSLDYEDLKEIGAVARQILASIQLGSILGN
jgi:hypothetical protein